MKNLGTVTLVTDRLILRRFELKDAPFMFKNWASDEEVTRFLTWQKHENIGVTEWVINSWIENYTDEKYYQWAIVLKEIDQPIGSISVVRINESIGEYEVGYCMGKPWWGKGIMAEALIEVKRFLFDEVGAKRIKAVHDVNNPNSGRVMVKAGFTYCERLHKAAQNNQGVVDIDVYIIKNGSVASPV